MFITNNSNNSGKGYPRGKKWSTKTQGHTGVLGSIRGGGKGKGSLSKQSSDVPVQNQTWEEHTLFPGLSFFFFF